jgi:oxalate decarboxylase
MTEQDKVISNDGVSRRSFLEKTSAALVAAASLPFLAAAQQTKDMSRDTHSGLNEKELGPKNRCLEAQEPDSVYPPETDAGGQPPFKYPFAMAHRRIESGGWTRQVTVREFPLSKKMAEQTDNDDPSGARSRDMFRLSAEIKHWQRFPQNVTRADKCW